MPEEAETYPWRPDWCLAPSETLKDWLSENGMSPRVLSVACGGKLNKPAALALVTDVLERKPLTAVHAACLARGTFVPARFWLALEHNYRAGLAAGLKDASDPPPAVTGTVPDPDDPETWAFPGPPDYSGTMPDVAVDPEDEATAPDL